MIIGLKIDSTLLLLMNVFHSLGMICQIMSATTFYSLCWEVFKSGGRFPRTELQDVQSRGIRFNILLFRIELQLKLTVVPLNYTRTHENRTNVCEIALLKRKGVL